jgi:ubiquinone/menaquinone biosynthesis C-methylase UbiE
MDRPLRASFDDVAERYDRARPGYPAELFDDLAALTGLRAGDRVLEIGPGTGQATLPLARRALLACIGALVDRHGGRIAKRDLIELAVARPAPP